MSAESAKNSRHDLSSKLKPYLAVPVGGDLEQLLSLLQMSDKEKLIDLLSEFDVSSIDSISSYIYKI